MSHWSLDPTPSWMFALRTQESLTLVLFLHSMHVPWPASAGTFFFGRKRARRDWMLNEVCVGDCLMSVLGSVFVRIMMYCYIIVFMFWVGAVGSGIWLWFFGRYWKIRTCLSCLMLIACTHVLHFFIRTLLYIQSTPVYSVVNGEPRNYAQSFRTTW